MAKTFSRFGSITLFNFVYEPQTHRSITVFEYVSVFHMDNSPNFVFQKILV